MEATVTQENREQITRIATSHYDNFDVLKVAEYQLNKKIELIFNELPNVYKALEEAKVLPEGMNLDTFMRVVLPRLEMAAQEAHIRQTFGISL